VVLRNSLNEVEKREKQLALNEAQVCVNNSFKITNDLFKYCSNHNTIQVARLKADLHRDYENKLVELREASKRVQEKADHQSNLVM